MTTATATTLGDIPRESIDRITWVALSSRPYFITSRRGIDEWIARFATVPLQQLDGSWHTIESSVPYRCFSVFVR